MICPDKKPTIISSKFTQKHLFIGLNFLFFSTFSYSQNVGIGTASPTEKLHVVGNARITALSNPGTIGDRMVTVDPNGVLGTQALPATVTAGNGLISTITAPPFTLELDVVAENGLTTNPDNIRLGGSLLEDTRITHDIYNLIHELNSSGDFHIATGGSNRFSVLDNGRTTVGSTANAGRFNVTGDSYFSDDLFLRDGAVDNGDILVRIYDSSDDGIIDIYENNAYNIRLHGNGPSIFNEQGINTNDFRIETSGQANMFFIDAGTNRIGIRTNTPASMLEMSNGGVAVGANAMADYENAGADGVALSGHNQGATNPYNAVEGISNYGGTAFITAGVFGLAINSSQTHRAIGVRGAANGRDGVGVRGSRQNTGGTVGWGGIFYNDLGYTGFFGAASDEKAKKNIQPIQKALTIVHQLNPVTYYFDLETYPNMGLNTEMEYGFIAQEVQAILPEIVRKKNLSTDACQKINNQQATKENHESFVVMDYTRIIPILTKAIKEQQSIIDNQNQRILKLEAITKQIQHSQTK